MIIKAACSIALLALSTGPSHHAASALRKEHESTPRLRSKSGKRSAGDGRNLLTGMMGGEGRILGPVTITNNNLGAKDITNREGLGESPGITALEYLGTGYNIVEGNPRGSETSEIDPGFRQGVIQLVQAQSLLSIDQAFMVPNGTEFRYLTSCEFSSTSTELTTTTELQTRLDREAKISGGGGFNPNLGVVKFGNQNKFSLSGRFRSFERQTKTTELRSFESSAICTEFEASLQPYFQQELQPAFQAAVDSLPEWSTVWNDQETIDLWRNFINTYGTHYISKVVLGAKLIHTNTFTSRNIEELRTQNIDIGTSLSSKSNFGFNFDNLIGPALQAAGGAAGTALGGPAGGTFGSTVGTTVSTVINNFNGNSNANLQGSTSFKSYQSRLESIRSVVETSSEVNIGGKPPENGNWKVWADSVRERPMPILYELTSLLDVLPEELHRSFSDAVIAILSAPAASAPLPSAIASSLSFGVMDRFGGPISSYTFSAAANLRSLATLREPGGNTNFFSYQLQFQGSDFFVSAVFASIIQDNISPNTREDEKQLGVLRKANAVDQQGSLISGLSLNSFQSLFGQQVNPGAAEISVFRRTAGNVGELNAFSFLTADNLPNIPEIIAGVIHPQGFIFNEVFGQDPGFRVSQADDRNFIIQFNQDFQASPTVILFPILFPLSINITNNDVNTPGTFQANLKSASPKRIEVLVGREMSVASEQLMGFSFLALDGLLPANISTTGGNGIGIVHGVVTISFPGNNPGPNDISIATSGSGFTATAIYNKINEAVFQPVGTGPFFVPFMLPQLVGGIQIDFETPFSGIPAVIATPLTGNLDFFDRTDLSNSDADLFNQDVRLSSALVEHITKESTFIKSNVISGLLDPDFPGTVAVPVSFHFVAVGPIGNGVSSLA